MSTDPFKQLIRNLENIDDLDGYKISIPGVFMMPQFLPVVSSAGINVAEAIPIVEGILLQEGEKITPKMYESIVHIMRAKLDAAMSSSWGWIEGNRDIIDTGELKDSLSITIGTSGVEIKYDSEYAALVHYGGYIQPYGNPNADSVYLPARPWIDAVLGEAPGPVEPISGEEIAKGIL